MRGWILFLLALLVVLSQVPEYASAIDIQAGIGEFIQKHTATAKGLKEDACTEKVLTLIAGFLVATISFLQIFRGSWARYLCALLGTIILALTFINNSLFGADPRTLETIATDILTKIESFKDTFDRYENLSDPQVINHYWSQKSQVENKISLLTRRVEPSGMKSVCYWLPRFVSPVFAGVNTPGDNLQITPPNTGGTIIDLQGGAITIEGRSFEISPILRDTIIRDKESLYFPGVGEGTDLDGTEEAAESSAVRNFKTFIELSIEQRTLDTVSARIIAENILSSTDIIIRRFYKKADQYVYFVLMRADKEAIIENYHDVLKEYKLPDRVNMKEILDVGIIREVYAKTLQLSEVEIRDWLENYRQVLEKGNVDELVKLGVLSSQEAGEARNILAGYEDFHVALQNENIRIEGSSATVTFTQRETINNRPMLPFDRTFTIEKEADGRIVITRRR